MATVAFSYDEWILEYPEFAPLFNAGRGQVFFNMAGLYLNNTDTSPVVNLDERGLLLYMLTSHIAALSVPVGDPGRARLVGKFLNAAQGSVNIGLSQPSPNTPEWYQQTTYGLSYWQATIAYRTARYVVPPQRCAGWPFYRC